MCLYVCSKTETLGWVGAAYFHSLTPENEGLLGLLPTGAAERIDTGQKACYRRHCHNALKVALCPPRAYPVEPMNTGGTSCLPCGVQPGIGALWQTTHLRSQGRCQMAQQVNYARRAFMMPALAESLPIATDASSCVRLLVPSCRSPHRVGGSDNSPRLLLEMGCPMTHSRASPT